MVGLGFTLNLSALFVVTLLKLTQGPVHGLLPSPMCRTHPLVVEPPRVTMANMLLCMCSLVPLKSGELKKQCFLVGLIRQNFSDESMHYVDTRLMLLPFDNLLGRLRQSAARTLCIPLVAPVGRLTTAQRQMMRRSGLPLRVHRLTRFETLGEVVFLSMESIAKSELSPLMKVLPLLK